MGKKLLDNKILYMVLAIILAVGLWFYVRLVQGEPENQPVRDIPITFVGADILQQNGLMIEGDIPTVDLEVRADVTTLTKLTNRTITLRLDVSRITGPMDYSMSYDIVPPAGVSESDFTVLSHTPANVTFTVAKYETVQIPVRGVLSEGSSIADGFVGRGFQFEQDTISVSGRADLVSQVKSAQVTLSGENLSETVQENKTYQLLGADNQVLEDLEVTCEPESVDVTYEIWKEMEVPLKVILEPGGGATESNVSFQNLEPDRVTVLGRPEDMESLKDLTVAVINLADIDGTQIITRDIPLADGLEISGGVSTATFTITVDGLEKRSFEVSRSAISLLNVPEGFAADIRTASLSVTLRGKAEVMEEISADNIRGTVDLSSVEKASGTYLVPVRVQFDGVEGVGVLNGDYQVTVRLRST